MTAEDRLQYECYTWFHNSYPDYRGLLCYNLNNSRNKIEGNKNRGMGLQPGRSDLVLYWLGRAYMIEMKIGKGTQSPDQKKWQAVVESNGFEYYIVRSLKEFQDLVRGVTDG